MKLVIMVPPRGQGHRLDSGAQVRPREEALQLAKADLASELAGPPAQALSECPDEKSEINQADQDRLLRRHGRRLWGRDGRSGR